MKLIDKIISLLVVSTMILSCDNASNIDLPADSHFIKFFGGDGDQDGVDLTVAPDGTILLFGTTEVKNGYLNLYLVNSDANGNLLWEKTFGARDKNYQAKDIELTTDGRIMLAANQETVPGDNDVFLMTLDLSGNKIDSIVVRGDYGSTFGIGTDEDIVSITQIGNEFFACGSTDDISIKGNQGPLDTRDALHLRLNDNLTLVDAPTLTGTWNITNGFDAEDVATYISPNPAGGYFLFGYSNNQDNADGTNDFNFWYTSIGFDGESLNSNQYIGTVNDSEVLSSVIISPIQAGSGFLLTGVTSNASGTYDLYVAKLRSQLLFNPSDRLFEKNLNITSQGITSVRTSAANAVNSGYYIAANLATGGIQNILLTKINNDGTPAWQAPVQFGGTMEDMVGGVAELPDGRIVIIGTMSIGSGGEHKMVLMKLNQEGRFAK